MKTLINSVPGIVKLVLDNFGQKNPNLHDLNILVLTLPQAHLSILDYRGYPFDITLNIFRKITGYLHECMKQE